MDCFPKKVENWTLKKFSVLYFWYYCLWLLESLDDQVRQALWKILVSLLIFLALYFNGTFLEFFQSSHFFCERPCWKKKRITFYHWRDVTGHEKYLEGPLGNSCCDGCWLYSSVLRWQVSSPCSLRKLIDLPFGDTLAERRRLDFTNTGVSQSQDWHYPLAPKRHQYPNPCQQT